MQIKIFTKFNTIYDKEENSPKSRHRSKMMWCAESLQSCLTLCNTMNYSLSGFSVHGILQAILGWVVMPSSRGSSQPRDWTWDSCTTGILYHWAIRETHRRNILQHKNVVYDKLTANIFSMVKNWKHFLYFSMQLLSSYQWHFPQNYNK